MLPAINSINKPDEIKNRIFKYFVFTIAISWSPIIATYFIIFISNLQEVKFILYKSEICFMTIVLAANNLKDLSESHVLKNGKMLYNILYTLNILNIFFSILFFASSSSLRLSGTNNVEPESRQFWFVILTYILAAVMGLSVQIGGGIDEIKMCKKREGKDKQKYLIIKK